VVTVQAPFRADDPAVAEQKNRRYLESVRRHGGEPIVLDELTSEPDRATAFSEMDGLLLSGGADVAPAYYGEEPHPTTVVEPERDRLEESAFRAAEARSVPVFGICRGMQAINVFRGGGLVQDIGGHTSEAYPAPTRHVHPLAIAADSRLGRLVTEMTPSVNTYHHQAVPPDRLGAGLRIAGTSPHDDGDLVEAIEDTDPDRWLVGVQSHPERTESTPETFENLWRDFISAARRFAERDRMPAVRQSGTAAKG
jgi:putative glutamine amidotransferase